MAGEPVDMAEVVPEKQRRLRSSLVTRLVLKSLRLRVARFGPLTFCRCL